MYVWLRRTVDTVAAAAVAKASLCLVVRDKEALLVLSHGGGTLLKGRAMTLIIVLLSR